MNKEKIRLEQNIKASDKEKKDLALQIKSLENKITRIKDEHENEINQIQQDLDDQVDLISQLEKDKEKLERTLTETEESNNELRDQNVTLLEKLHNSEEENAIMRARLQAVDLKKYAVPPYTTSVRGKNYRSTAQRSSWG
jgi:chromosome segregation ATPase